MASNSALAVSGLVNVPALNPGESLSSEMYSGWSYLGVGGLRAFSMVLSNLGVYTASPPLAKDTRFIKNSKHPIPSHNKWLIPNPIANPPHWKVVTYTIITLPSPPENQYNPNPRSIVILWKPEQWMIQHIYYSWQNLNSLICSICPLMLFYFPFSICIQRSKTQNPL